MNTFSPATRESMSDLMARFQRFDDAGIDPIFDTECEELERQFAELRLANTSNMTKGE
jgi:hypothetical protein